MSSNRFLHRHDTTISTRTLYVKGIDAISRIYIEKKKHTHTHRGNEAFMKWILMMELG